MNAKTEHILNTGEKRAKCTIFYEERFIRPLYVDSPYIVSNVKEEKND